MVRRLTSVIWQRLQLLYSLLNTTSLASPDNLSVGCVIDAIVISEAETKNQLVIYYLEDVQQSSLGRSRGKVAGRKDCNEVIC